GDDGACAAVRAFPAPPGRPRVPDFHRHDDRPRVLPPGPAVLESRRAERLAATLLRDISAGRVHSGRGVNAVVDRTAIKKPRAAPPAGLFRVIRAPLRYAFS